LTFKLTSFFFSKEKHLWEKEKRETIDFFFGDSHWNMWFFVNYITESFFISNKWWEKRWFFLFDLLFLFIIYIIYHKSILFLRSKFDSFVQSWLRLHLTKLKHTLIVTKKMFLLRFSREIESRNSSFVIYTFVVFYCISLKLIRASSGVNILLTRIALHVNQFLCICHLFYFIQNMVQKYMYTCYAIINFNNIEQSSSS
jgi:hypothetical protein